MKIVEEYSNISYDDENELEKPSCPQSSSAKTVITCHAPSDEDSSNRVIHSSHLQSPQLEELTRLNMINQKGDTE